MLINAHSTPQSFTFGQSTTNKDDLQDLNFALPFAQSASSDSTFAETLVLDVEQNQPQNTITLRENFGLLGRIQKAEQAPKILGFPLDDEGYLSTTFNNAAGIPEDFKIHSETIVAFIEKKNRIPTSQELRTHFQQKYERLSEIFGDTFQTKTDYYTKEQLDSMPQAFFTNNGDYSGKIEELLYKDNPKINDYILGGGIAAIKQAPSYWSLLGLPNLNNSIQVPISLIPSEFELQNSLWGAQHYMDDNGNLSKSGLLAFAISLADSEFDNPALEFKTNAANAIKEGTMTIEEYLKQYVEGAFLEEKYRQGHQEYTKTQIAFASWLKDIGFREQDLNAMQLEDFSNLLKNFQDLLYAFNKLEEYEKRQKNFLDFFFDVEAFILQLFAGEQVFEKNLFNTPDSLLAEMEQKRLLESLQFLKPQLPDEEDLDVEDYLMKLFERDRELNPNLLDLPDKLFDKIEDKRSLDNPTYQRKPKEKQSLTQKVKNAATALAKIEQFLKSA